MNTQQLLKADLLDILFEGKNKTYGAYLLRKGYANRLLTALGLSIAATLLVSAILFWWPRKQAKEMVIIDEIVLNDENKKPPVKEEIKKIIPVIKTVKPPSTIRNVVPVIVPNTEVIDAPNVIETDKEIGKVNFDNGTNDGDLPSLPPTPSGTLNGGGGGGTEPQGTIVPPIPPKVETPNLGVKTKKPDGWDIYLRRALQPVADDAMNNGCEEGDYRIVVSFLVDETGNPTEANLLEGGDKCNLGTYAKAIILKGPNWPIARNANGEPIKSIQQTAITIRLATE